MDTQLLRSRGTLEEQPLISIVVPTYKQAGYLPTCLDALFFQDIDAPVEIIVVNDASPDDTRAVLDEYAAGLAEDTCSFVSDYDERNDAIVRTTHARYNRPGRVLRVVHHETNRGASATYTHGMKLAQGEFVTFVVSDDIPHPSMLSTLAAPLLRGEADFAYADMFIVDDAGRILRQFDLPPYSFRRSLANWYLLGVCKLYRRELHEKHGYFNDGLANDYDCFLRFALGGARFVHVPKVLYSVRSHHQRKTGLHTPDNEARILVESKALALRARASALFSREADECDGKDPRCCDNTRGS